MTTTTQTFEVNDGTSANGTNFQGYITTTYGALVDRLGPSREGSADQKTTADWVLKFEDGTVATIYDWKLSSTPTDPYEWHIGGKSSRAVDLVQEALGIERF